MKTLDELKTFCEGYRNALDNLASTDDWVTWGGYDINFIGSDYAEQADELFCIAYDANWTDNLGNPLHWFNV